MFDQFFLAGAGLIFGISQGVLILREAAFHLWKFESCDPMEQYRIHEFITNSAGGRLSRQGHMTPEEVDLGRAWGTF
jgi:hypothetical protein